MKAIDELTKLFSRFPGVGKKSAARMVFFLLKEDADYCDHLGESVRKLKERVKFCRSCGYFSEEELCAVCASPSRDRRVLCVVEQPRDVALIESIGEYRGLFHVLNGTLAPLDGIGPEELKLPAFFERIRREEIAEVILATNPTVEGDTTALYLAQYFHRNLCRVKVSRLASGIPVGGDLEYADKLSIARAFRSRQELDS